MLKCEFCMGRFVLLCILSFSFLFSSITYNIYNEKRITSSLDLVNKSKRTNNLQPQFLNQSYLTNICNWKLVKLLCPYSWNIVLERRGNETKQLHSILLLNRTLIHLEKSTLRCKQQLNHSIILWTIKILLIISLLGIFFSTEKSKLSWEIPGLGYSWKFVFEFQSIHTQGTQCYPSSIRNYFSDIDKSESVTKEKFMNYEWIRLSSFKEFPSSSKVSSIRLAQSGFYYSGNGEEAVCFCCGIRNDSWNESENVNEIHRRLSPNCRFLNGERTNNVAIHGDSRRNSRGSSNESSHPTEGASGGPEDMFSENNRQTEGTNPSESSQPLPTYEDAVGVPDDVLASSSRQEASHHIEQNIDRSKDMHTNETRGSVTRFPGIVNEQPKHPEYAIKSVRLNSYTGWPPTSSVQPEELSTAGFFYAGIRDCVRCFFCGGGMKNWEYGDSPWIEHARWFPNCAYVKQCKGADFVEMCQTANTQISSGNEAESSPVSTTEQVTIAEDSFIEDLNSTAAVMVIDMGYTQTQAEDAIKRARVKHGNVELKAHYLLEFLLENNYTPPTTSSPMEPSPRTKSRVQSNGNDKPPMKSNNKKPTYEQRALYEENRQLKEQMLCKICLDKDANVVFLPCGHMVACVECAHALRKCAICRKVIQGTVRTYQS